MDTNLKHLSDVELAEYNATAEMLTNSHEHSWPNNMVKRILDTITRLKAEKAELQTEYRKVELLWKESAVAADDFKQQAEAKDALWMGATARFQTAEARLASVVEALDHSGEECPICKGGTYSGKPSHYPTCALASIPTAASNLLDRVKRAEEDATSRFDQVVRLMGRIKELEANARTPGTVEVCPREGTVKGPMRCGLPIAFGKITFKMCRLSKDDEPCPIKRASSEEKNNDT